LLSHGIDIIAFSVFQYLSLGPSSPFFVYFIFSLFCGAIRWSWRGTLVTGAVAMAAYVGMAMSISNRFEQVEFEVNRFVIRIAYLAMATGMLVFLGRYEARLRSEIERLARWPVSLSGDPKAAVRRVLEYGARVMSAGQAVAVWEATEEPVIHEARWSAGAFVMQHWPPDQVVLRPEDQAELQNATFLCPGDVTAAIFISYTQNIDTTTPMGRLFYHVIGSFAEFEREMIVERVRAGLANARAKGKSLGRPKDRSAELRVVALRQQGLSLREIANQENRSASGVLQILRRAGLSGAK
jgi:hypothetical protein